MALLALAMADVAGRVGEQEAGCGERLLKGNFAHGLCADDFADVEPLYSGGATLVLSPHDLLNDGIHLVTQIIECSPVRIFNQD